MWKVSLTKTAKIFRGKTFGNCSNTLLCKICGSFFSFARFKASHAICFIHQDCDLWLLAANTKHRQECKVVIWHNSAGKLFWPGEAEVDNFWECALCFSLVVLCESEKWHRRPLKRALPALKARRRLLYRLRISRSFFFTSVYLMFASFCAHIQLLCVFVFWDAEHMTVCRSKEDGICAWRF